MVGVGQHGWDRGRPPTTSPCQCFQASRIAALSAHDEAPKPPHSDHSSSPTTSPPKPGGYDRARCVPHSRFPCGGAVMGITVTAFGFADFSAHVDIMATLQAFAVVGDEGVDAIFD